LSFRTVVKGIIGLAVAVAALDLGLYAYVSYRYSNVRTIKVSKLADLDEVFEVGTSSLRVRNPEFLKVCFAADYVDALENAQKWFASDETEFKPALAAAGGLADTFNDEGSSSIVLLSHTSAVILKLDRRTGFAVAIVGCASAANDIEIRKSRSEADGVEFWLPNATLEQRGITLRIELEKAFDRLAATGKLSFRNDVTASILPYISAGMTFEEAESVLRAAGFIVYPHPGAREEQDRNRPRDWYAVLAEIPEFSRRVLGNVAVYVTLYPEAPGDYGNVKDLKASIFVTIL